MTAGLAAGAAGFAAFAATNVDDFFILVAFFAAGSYRARDIVLGQSLGIAALFGASLAAAALSMAIPSGDLRLLGLIPIVLGLREVRRALAPAKNDSGGNLPEKHGLLAVAGVTVANGGDNLAVYTALFANSTAFAIAVYGAVFVAATALWCLAAHRLARQPAGAAPLRRYGRRAMPAVLIGIGVFVLAS